MSDNKFTSWEVAVTWLLKQSDQEALVLACYFDRPALQAAQRYHASDEWLAIKKILPISSGKVLDVGAGMGIASYAFAADGWNTTALEPDPSGLVGANAIRALSNKAKIDISVVEEWGERLPFPDNCFDVIHARQVLHHADDLTQFCMELYRVLKPGGYVLATREHVISNRKQLPLFLANHPLHNLYGGENAFLRKEYIYSLENAGFTLKKVLGPWGTVINSTPFTRQKLLQLFEIRFVKSRVLCWFAQIAFSKYGFHLVRPVLGLLDHRPGRLYTFLAKKYEKH